MSMSFNEVTKTPGVDAFGYEKNFRTALPQVIAVGIKNLILIAFGTSLGFPTILIPAIQKGGHDATLQLDSHEISWIGSINLICVPLGCLASGLVTSLAGRKRTMQVVNVPFVVSWVLAYCATSAGTLYAGLALSGIAGGLLEAPVVTYVAEITQPHLRGALTASSVMVVILGVFIQFILGISVTWRTAALINVTIPITAIIALFFVPESPFWLVSKGRFAEGKKSLQWLRGWTTEDKVELEYRDLCEFIKEKDKKHTFQKSSNKILEKFKPFGKKTFIYPYFLVGFCFFLGHFCGMTTLQTYAILIFETLKAPLDKYQATFVLGLVQMVGTTAGVGLIHFTGKRPLVFASMIGVAACFIAAGGYAYYIQEITGVPIRQLANRHVNSVILDTNIHNSSVTPNSTTYFDSLQYTESNLAWIPLAVLITSALISHCGIRLLPWILMGEVFSPETRGMGAGMSCGIGYIFGFISNKLFLDIVHTLTLSGTFWLYSAISLTGAAILYFILPETEGYTLSEISHHFTGVKKLPNRVHRDGKSHKIKMPSNRKMDIIVESRFSDEDGKLISPEYSIHQNH